MTNATWVKIYDDELNEYEYYCTCGQAVSEDDDYNADNGTLICEICGSESPDIENIIDAS